MPNSTIFQMKHKTDATVHRRYPSTDCEETEYRMCEWCRPVMYRIFIWAGAKRIQQVMEAKGYIIGTSQVSHSCSCHDRF